MRRGKCCAVQIKLNTGGDACVAYNDTEKNSLIRNRHGWIIRVTHHMYTFPVFPCQISGALREMGMTFNAFGPYPKKQKLLSC